jgi:protein required for attachment to host cells
MAHQTTWILIANAGRARIFARRGRTQPWQAVREFAHSQSTAKVSELVTDKAGRVQQRMGSRRSAADPQTSPKEVEARHFAQELAAALHEGLERGTYKRLVLVAPPHFLGLLRHCTTPAVHEAVSASINHDLTNVAAHDLPARLASALERL